MENQMYRAEIISNQSVQDDIVELIEQEVKGIQYTIIPDVHGKGMRSKKLGDTTWPEMNFVFYAYVNLQEAQKIKAIVESAKKKFPAEGISVFFVKCEEI